MSATTPRRLSGGGTTLCGGGSHGARRLGWGLVLLFGVALSGATVRAEEPAECPAFAAVQPLGLDECDVVFDAAQPVEAERVGRELGVEQIIAGTHAIDIVYRGSLAEPSEMSFVDVALLGTDVREGCPPVALLEIAVAAAADSCTAGLYVVAPGTRLGLHGTVAAVLDDVLLLVWGEELRFLKTAEAADPVWRMVWHPPWRLVRPRQATSVPPPRPQRPGRRR